MNKEKIIIIGKYQQEKDFNLDDFKIFFQERDFVFWGLTFTKKNYHSLVKYMDSIGNELENKHIIVVDDIDKKWKNWNNITKSMILLLKQGKEINIRNFNFKIKTTKFFLIIWGINPLPSDDDIIKDIQLQLKMQGL